MVIELDGYSHDETADRDATELRIWRNRDCAVGRFSDDESSATSTT
jgi:very-short-patch-repair endonuclease